MWVKRLFKMFINSTINIIDGLCLLQNVIVTQDIKWFWFYCVTVMVYPINKALGNT